jgi:hypothetical protein
VRFLGIVQQWDVIVVVFIDTHVRLFARIEAAEGSAVLARFEACTQ